MMQNPRVFLWLGLALVLWLNYQAWLQDYAPPPGMPAPVASTSGANGPVESPAAALNAAIPQASSPAAASPAAPVASTGLATEAEAAPQGGVIRVRTDVLDLDISTQGGTLQRADLLRYPKVKGGSQPVRLMSTADPEHLYLLQTGLTGPAGASRPTHLTPYASERRDYELGSAAELRVPLIWNDGNGVEVRKLYLFKRGEYRIDIAYEISNKSGAAWEVAPYARILRNDPATQRSIFSFDAESYAFHGPAIFDGTKYRKLDIEDEEDRKLSLDVRNGWISALQHHFVGAVVPARDVTYRYRLDTAGRNYSISAAGPMTSVAAGATGRLDQTLFVGPKLQAQLEDAGPRLELVADYGMLTFLASPLFWLLGHVYAFLGNWGWAIVVVTFLLKLVFYPLSEASGKSMAKMKLLAPRIKNMQETYKDDREKLGRAMMELYSREKINPVAGCLPMLIQIPVFLAFYWVLLESVEMRQAPFFGWINDLSARDPLFILPAIMAAAMFAQFKLNPTPPDPVQAKVFMIMPLVMSVMFAFFPAGLVLYWVTNTVLSIAQQWNINRRIEGAKKA
jgi:YidC/Oxa1 family membrane protein insertase